MLQTSASRYSVYANGVDVELALKSASFWPEGADDSTQVLLAREQAQIGADAARDEFMLATGRFPFISLYDQAATIPYDVQARQICSHGVLQLNADLLRLDGVTVNGVALPLTGGYVITKPSEAPMIGKPYTFLLLPRLRDRYRRGADDWLRIEVTGRWGYCTTCPADAWVAMQQAAALSALLVIENLQSIASISTDGFSKALDVVGTNQQKDVVNLWRKNWPEAINKYKRVVV